jgi:hypothetical protein
LRVRRIHLRWIRPTRAVPRVSGLPREHPIDPRRSLEACRSEGRPHAKRRAEPAQRFPPNGCPVFRKLFNCTCGGFTCGGSALREPIPANPVFHGDIQLTPAVRSKPVEAKGDLTRNVGRNPRSGFRRMAARCFGNSSIAHAADSPAVDPPYEGRSPRIWSSTPRSIDPGRSPRIPFFTGLQLTPVVRPVEAKGDLTRNVGRNPRSGFRRMAARCFGNCSIAHAADSPAVDPPYEGRSPRIWSSTPRSIDPGRSPRIPFSTGLQLTPVVRPVEGKGDLNQTQGGIRAAVSAEWLPGVSETPHLRVRRIHLRWIRPTRAVPRVSGLPRGHPIDPRRSLEACRSEGRPHAKRRAEPAQRFPPNGCPVFRKLRICACGGFTCGGSALREPIPANPVFRGDIQLTPAVRSKPVEAKADLTRNVGRNPRSGFRRMAARCFGNSSIAHAADSPAVDPPYEGRSPRIWSSTPRSIDPSRSPHIPFSTGLQLTPVVRPVEAKGGLKPNVGRNPRSGFRRMAAR